MQQAETKKWDLAGIGLSVLCAIHCLSVPFLMGVLPMVGLDFVGNHEFEWVMMSIIFLVAGISYANGFRRHGKKAIFVFLATGVFIFTVVRPLLGHDQHDGHVHLNDFHHIATVMGGLVFVLGHWKNWHWHKPSCKKPCCAHEKDA